MDIDNLDTNEYVEGGNVEAVDEEKKSLEQIARHLVKRALDANGSLDAEAKIQIGLREAPERLEILENLLLEVCPRGVNIPIWLKWLEQGPSPFDVSIRKVGSAKESPATALSRSGPRVRGQTEKVEKLRASLAAEEKRLEFYKAFDNAALHWHVVDQLVGLMSATFAMGPAWALMRVVSPFASQAEVEFETRYLFEDEVREEGERRFREQRKTESAELLEALDFFKGDMRFERDLRKKIKEVVEDHESRRPALKAQGRRSRSKDAMRNSIAPHGRADMEEILASFCWAD